jgi:SPP1 gp7 family putative phage head morphogenesis protein
MCNYCDIINAEVSENENGSVEYKAPDTPITEEFLDTYTMALYLGIVTQYKLSGEMYGMIGGYLDDAILKGYKTDYPPFSPHAKTFNKLRENIWHFSAAKQYTQNRDILQSFVAPLEQVSFKEFKDVADPILRDYNKSYLATEWETAVSNSQSARDWGNLMQDDTIDFIEYRTQEDSRVRHEHRRLNHARYPKGHSFWNNYFPPNGWRCRCFTVNYDSDTSQTTINNPPPFGTNEMPDVFKLNPGKEKIIFPNSHPYFRVAQGDKVFREVNYNMPMPQTQ